MNNLELKLHAADFTRALIANMFEGFHGSMYEMTEGLFSVAPELFTGEFDPEFDDAEFGEPSSVSRCAWNANQMIASNVYKQTVFGMIAMVSDHLSSVVDNAFQRLAIADGMMTHANAEAATFVINDMCNALEATGDASPLFTRSYFIASL